MASFSVTKYSLIVSNLHQDVGGSTEQQDDGAVLDLGNNNAIFVMADGHGNLGKCASNTTIRKCKEYFTLDKVEELKASPYKVLTDAFNSCQIAVHDEFLAKLAEPTSAQRYSVTSSGDELRIIQKRTGLIASSIGGTTLTIVAKLDHMLYIANVADTEAGLFTDDLVLNKDMIQVLGDSAYEAVRNGFGENIHYNPTTVVQEQPEPYYLLKELENSCSLEMTTDEHSPENPREFKRCRAFRADRNNPMLPHAKFEYGSNTHMHHRDIFKIDEEGNPTATGNSFYIKNMRGHNACTMTAELNSLAMTRNIGDFGSINSGLTHRPEVRSVDLKTVFAALRSDNSSDTPQKKYLGFVLATDGIWDCYKSVDIKNFLFFGNCIESVQANGVAGVDAVARSFMQKHIPQSTKIFGSGRDNATMILAYISEEL